MSLFEEVNIKTPYNKFDNVLKLTIGNEANGYRLADLVSEVGEYFFSIWHKADSPTDISLNLFGQTEQLQSTTEWKKYTKVIKVQDITNNNIDIIPNKNSFTYFYEGFLSKGSANTSWLPAPEDTYSSFENVNSQILQKAGEILLKVEQNYTTKTELGTTTSTIRSEITQTASNIRNEIKNTDGRVSTLSTTVDGIDVEVKKNTEEIGKLNVSANEIKGEIRDARGNKASLKLALDGLQTEVSNNKNEISKVRQEAGEILQTVNKTLTDNYYNKTETNSQISQSASTITQSVNKTLTDNYYNKTETNSQINQKAEDINLSVGQKFNDYYTKSEVNIELGKISSTVIGNINVGAKNLLLKSDENYTNTSHLIASYKMTEKMTSSKEYTCTIWGSLGTGKSHFSICLNSSTNVLGQFENKNDGTYQVTFKGIQNNTDSSEIQIYAEYSGTYSESTIDKIKLEKGAVGTDFTLAPEEYISGDIFDQAINGVKDDSGNVLQEGLSQQVALTMSTVSQLSDSISHLVVDEKGSSLMTQKGDRWEFNMGAVQNTLKDTAERLDATDQNISDAKKLANETKNIAEALSHKTAFIHITTLPNGQPAILLGQSNSQFKLRITNTSIDFLQGDEAVAYISNQNLYITKSIIKDELQIGDGTGWIWKRRANGNLGLRWIG